MMAGSPLLGGGLSVIAALSKMGKVRVSRAEHPKEKANRWVSWLMRHWAQIHVVHQFK